MLLGFSTTPRLLGMFRRLAATGTDVQVSEDIAELRAQAENAACEALVLGYDEPALAEIAPSALAKVVLLVENESQLAALQATHRQVGCLLLRAGGPLPEELLVAVQKHTRKDLLGLEKYVAWGTELRTMQLTDSSRRGEAMDALDTFLSALALDARVVAQMLTIADELITNAFFNAPVDAAGRRLYATRSRIDQVLATGDHAVQVSFAFDGRSAAVAVRDSYGTFEWDVLMKSVMKALGEPQVSFGTSGAGLGISTALRASSQLVFNVMPRRYTECIGLIDATGPYRKFVEHSKSVHIFYGPQEAG